MARLPLPVAPSLQRNAKVTLVVDRAHYDDLVHGAVARAQVSLWIATANVKQMMVEAPIGSAARARGRRIAGRAAGGC